jgi:phenylpropionate dioxygenase-like ring-hydroxylating dioxygenase large terminal subunit
MGVRELLTQEENLRLTQTGPSTPGGALMRRYWQPAALSEEVPVGGAPLPVRLLGENLVLFRDEQGRPGLLGLHCPHRGADLSYGRLEDGGLRCLYHGWLFDVTGQCLEQPGEPAGSTFCQRVRHTAYPCLEVAGVIFAYLGPGEPPLLPAYELFTVPESYRFAPTKSFHDCNYLQANEGNIDPVHLAFLHRLRPGARGARPAPGSDKSADLLLLGDVRPTVEIEETDYGLRIYAVRQTDADAVYVRITNFVMPNLCAIAGSTGQDGYQIDWHVPIDDTCHWKYTMGFRHSAPVERDARLRGDAIAAGYRRVRHAGNRYGQDRTQMGAESFAGMGTNFLDHDAFAVESQGPIQDRTHERLGTTDRAVSLARQMLLRAIRDVEVGADPPHVVRDERANNFAHLVVRAEVVPSAVAWRTYWQPQALAARPGGGES